MMIKNGIFLTVLTLIASVLMSCTKEYVHRPHGQDFKTSSGMKVIIRRDGDAVTNSAELRLVVRTGSLQEKDSERGYAHFVEHMAFNSTHDYPKGTLIPALEKMGISIGQHTNAQTHFGHTIYSLSLNNLTNEKLETAVEILAQWAKHIEFDQQVIDEEIPVIREEWRLRHLKENDWRTKYFATLSNGSRYADRLPIGTLESIEAAQAEDLRAFYQRWYHPRNMALIATGDVNPKQVRVLADQLFGNWGPENPVPSTVYNIPTHSLPSVQPLVDERVTGSQVAIEFYTEDHWPQNETELFDAILAQAVLGILEQRLDAQVINTKGSVSDTYTYWSRPSPEVLNYSLNATLPGQEIEAAVNLLLGERDRLLSNGISDEELKRWRRNTLQNLRLSQPTSASLASLAVDHFLYGLPLLEKEQRLSLLEKQLPKVTLERINYVANHLLGREPKLTVVTSSALLSSDTVQLEKLLQQKPQNYYAEAVAQHEQSDWPVDPAQSGEILQTRLRANDVTEWQLSNGMTVLYRHSNAKPGKVYYHLAGAGGMNQLTQQESINARLALPVMAASGLRNYTASELSRWLSDQGIEYHPAYRFFDRGIKGSGPTEHFETMMRQLHIALTEARVLPEVWEHVLEKNKQQVAQLERSNQMAWRAKIDEHLFRQDTALRVINVAELEKIESVNLNKIYRNYFAGAQNYNIAIVGDISKYEVKKMVTNFIATLPPSLLHTNNPVRPFPRMQQPVDVRVSGSGEQAALVTLKHQLPKSALTELSGDQLHFLKVWLNQKLLSEVREKHGLVYAIGSKIEGMENGWNDFTLTLEFACDPNKIEQTKEIIRQTLQSMGQEPPSSEQVAVWEKSRQTELKKFFADPNVIASLLVLAQVQGENLDNVANSSLRGRAPEPQALADALNQFTGTVSIPASLVWMP